MAVSIKAVVAWESLPRVPPHWRQLSAASFVPKLTVASRPSQPGHRSSSNRTTRLAAGEGDGVARADARVSGNELRSAQSRSKTLFTANTRLLVVAQLMAHLGDSFRFLTVLLS